MRRFAENFSRRTDEPLDCIHQMRQRILNRAATGLVIVIINLAVSRAESGEMLASDDGHL